MTLTSFRTSVREDRLQLLHDLVLGMRLRDRELLHEQIARGVEHLALAERELFVALQHEKIAQDFGDLENRSGLDLFRVLAVAPIPGLLIDFDFLVSQDLVDFRDHVATDDAAKTDAPDVFGGDHDGHVAVENAQHVKLPGGAGDRLRLDALDDADTMCRIDDLLTDLERIGHATSIGIETAVVEIKRNRSVSQLNLAPIDRLTSELGSISAAPGSR